MEAGVKEKRRWLIEFGLISLVPIVILGLFLGQAIRSHASGRVIAATRDQSQLVGNLAFRRVLHSGRDLARGIGPDQEAALDRALASARQGTDLARAILRDRAGTIVYADNHELIGSRGRAPAEAEAALNGGSISKVGDLSRDASAQDSALGRVLDVFVPMRLGGSRSAIVGSLERSSGSWPARRSAFAARRRRRRSRRCPTGSPACQTGPCSRTSSSAR
ncbi:MAG: hypothetical protein E6G07_07525 [Actinobacteria bacterium]|nr:MAG: hypothetical protein E6G07_07525 [Actinomycetota bacterium]